MYGEIIYSSKVIELFLGGKFFVCYMYMYHMITLDKNQRALLKNPFKLITSD